MANPNKWFYLPLLLLPLTNTAAWAVGETTRVSVASDGTQANGTSGYYSRPSLSADGRFVALDSWATNLVADDTNNTLDIFIHDRQTGKTTRVSVASTGTQANGMSSTPSLSADGRFVAFWSIATNLVAGDTNGEADIFVHDRQTGQTTRASVKSSGKQANRDGFSGSYFFPYSSPRLSADGRYVAFESGASNLVAGDTNSWPDIFVHDRLTGKTTRTSVASDGTGAYDGHSSCPSLSANGRFVAFHSYASNLVAGGTNYNYNIFVHDRLTGQTTQVSIASDGTPADGGSEYSSISADGRFVAFESFASNLVAGDTNGSGDIFVHDRKTGVTTKASIASSKGWALPSLSADGRYVAFNSAASKLVKGDTNRTKDVFVRDRLLKPRYTADLQITATDTPNSLPTNSQGTFRYTITNNGPEPVIHTRLVHSVSNGKVVSFNPSQGRCDHYATLSLCNFGKLEANASITLEMQVKATNDPLSQLLSVSPLAKEDMAPDNNSVTVNTLVTPAQ